MLPVESLMIDMSTYRVRFYSIIFSEVKFYHIPDWQLLYIVEILIEHKQTHNKMLCKALHEISSLNIREIIVIGSYDL